MDLTPLTSDYFARPTLDVARDVLGKLLVHRRTPHQVRGRLSGVPLVGRIVETEGYTQDDPAFRGWGVLDRETGLLRPEGRGYDLFGTPGTAYVYLVYDRHWMLNVVTEREGVGGAVLLRAVEPVEGLEVMRANRPAARRDRDLTNGPGKLTEAFGIDRAFHNQPLTAPPLYLADDGAALDGIVATSSRIGLRHGIERPWRFFFEGNPYVSPGLPSDVAAERRKAKRRS